LRKFINTTVNLGVNPKSSLIEQRRVRLVNSILLVILVLIVSYSVGNALAGSARQGLFILTCIPICVAPTFYFNYLGKTKTARFYFVLVAWLLITFLNFNAIFNLGLEDRNNIVFVVGFSAMVIVLFENPWKLTLFGMFVLTVLAMKTANTYHIEKTFDANFYLSQLNIVVACVSIYFFTSIFWKDLIDSLNRITSYSTEIEKNQKKILTQHNELMLNRQMIRTALDSMPVYISMINKEGKFLLVNNQYADSFRMAVHQLEGRNYEEILPEKYISMRKSTIDKCLQGYEMDFDDEIKLPDGKKIHGYGKYQPLYDYDGNIMGAMSYAFDITKQKTIENELKAHNKTKDRLLSIISHDFRAPLNSLKEVMSLAAHIDPEDMENLIRRISVQVDTVSSTLDNLLNWVKTQLEGFHLKSQTIDLSKIIKKSLLLYEEPISQKSIKVENMLIESTLVYADLDHMYLVFRNLINNAIKFTPQKGKITIKSERTNGITKIVLKDSGIGMDKTQLDTIKSGNKITNSTIGTAGEKGSGLGLSFSMDILKLNKVKMNIKSQKEEGTEITLEFDNNKIDKQPDIASKAKTSVNTDA
jgi:PAS domain S-box-containing protein